MRFLSRLSALYARKFVEDARGAVQGLVKAAIERAGLRGVLWRRVNNALCRVETDAEEDGNSQAVKIVIERKIKAGKEDELGAALRELRSRAIHAQGYIFWEGLRGIEDLSLNMVISTWNSLGD